MLPKRERLSRAEFNRFFAAGKRIHTPSMLVVYTAHTSLHVSVVVSKKISNKAVVRNKIRRQIYDIVRRYRDSRPLTGVFIFLTKKEVSGRTRENLQHEVCTLLEKVTT